MAHDAETRQAVRAAFIYEKRDLGTAAEQHGVARGTAQRWKAQAAEAGDDWDSARAAASLSQNDTRTIAELVLADFLTVYQATMAEIQDTPDMPPASKVEYLSKMADAYTKTMSAVAKASPDLGRYAVATELLRDLAIFTREQYPDHLEVILELLEPFAAVVAKKYNR